jgi:hypothetical protein
MKRQALTTSIHPHPVFTSSPRLASTMQVTIPTPKKDPTLMPSTGLLTRCLTPFPPSSNPHKRRIYILAVKLDSTTACPANTTSLNCTVGVRPWFRAAYSPLMVFE